MSSRRSALLLAALGLLAAVVLLAGPTGLLPSGSGSADVGRPPASVSTEPVSLESMTRSVPETLDADRERSRTLTPVSGTAAAPERVSVPRLGIDSALDRLGTDDRGVLEKPPRWQVAGWFSGGPRPGESGPAVIAGHVDSPTGPAVFARLSEVRAGDRIDVRRADGSTATFRVDRTEVSPKKGFPTQAVYGPTPDAQLRLVTCDGPYVDGAGGYQDNLIVFATEEDR